VEFADAVVFAARVYGASRDRSGVLFLAHGINVAQALGRDATASAMSAAVLHGMLDDTEWTIDDLARSGVDPLECEVIDVLTRQSGETYTDYVRRICDAPGVAGDTARLVMVADLTVSADRADSDALRERYEQSLPLVRSALASAVG
jgi:guanosine-3',5'-bis(diphosphate) 3'-pyrophosphohydrolase